MKRILFICHGNICRSPMAEFIMKDLVKKHGVEGKYHIESAAVSEEEIGNPIYPMARQCLTKHGVPFDPMKRARRVVPSDYDNFDRLICMDGSNLRWLKWIIPDDPQCKVSLMMSFAGENRDVVDPWYPPCDFDTTFHDIKTACEAMLKKDLGK